MRGCAVGERTKTVFLLGLVIGVVGTAAAAVFLDRRHRRRIAELEGARTALVRRIAELEQSAAEVRDARLRAEREFNQYKILLKRADRALADARAARDSARHLAA